MYFTNEFRKTLIDSTYSLLSNNHYKSFNIKKILETLKVNRNNFYQLYETKDSFIIELLDILVKVLHLTYKDGETKSLSISISKEELIKHHRSIKGFINMFDDEYLLNLIIYKYNLMKTFNKEDKEFWLVMIRVILYKLKLAINEMHNYNLDLIINDEQIKFNQYS